MIDYKELFEEQRIERRQLAGKREVELREAVEAVNTAYGLLEDLRVQINSEVYEQLDIVEENILEVLVKYNKI